uniref:Uncharacterized protein n=1 Tax=Arundo donax TaxID=35708 RepID=A0A0A9HQR1_ARUDO
MCLFSQRKIHQKLQQIKQNRSRILTNILGLNPYANVNGTKIILVFHTGSISLHAEHTFQQITYEMPVL